MLTSMQWASQLRFAEPSCSLILLGCQSDTRYRERALDNTVTYDEGLQKAREINAVVYLECSAKTSAGINDLFEVLTKCCVLCDIHDTWKKGAINQKPVHKKQSSMIDFTRLPVGLRKSSRTRTGFRGASWLIDRLPA